MASLKSKLFSAAIKDAGLFALLSEGSPAILRWYDTQLPQGSNFPSVTVQVISNPRTYAIGGRLPTSFARVQMNIFGSGADSEDAEAVVQAIANFLVTFNPMGIDGLAVYPNTIVGDRDAGIAATDPLTYERILDVMVFDNELV